MSSDNKLLTLLVYEWSNQMEVAFPTIMHIDTKNGNIKESYSLEYNKQLENLRDIWGFQQFDTYGAIFTDDHDPWSSNYVYTYASFVRDGIQEFVRIRSQNNQRPNIDYFYQFMQDTVKRDRETHLQKNVPQKIVEDVADKRYLYLAGRYGGAASVFKFSKQSF